jgi:hypothetical protein
MSTTNFYTCNSTSTSCDTYVDYWSDYNNLYQTTVKQDNELTLQLIEESLRKIDLGLHLDSTLKCEISEEVSRLLQSFVERGVIFNYYSNVHIKRNKLIIIVYINVNPRMYSNCDKIVVEHDILSSIYGLK